MKTTSVHAALCCAIVWAIAGCVSQPKGKEGKDARDGAYIEYSLPFTSLQLTTRMVLTDCQDKPRAKAEVTLAPVVGASPYPSHTLTVKGKDLTSFTKKRDLKIELHPHRAIKSINGGVSDRTGAILVNVVKFAALLAAAPSSETAKDKEFFAQCNEATRSALARAKALKGRIKELRGDLGDDPAETMKRVDALAAELVRVESGQLTLNFTKLIPIDLEQKGGTLSWSREELSKWFVGGREPLRNFRIAWCLEDWAPGIVTHCTLNVAQSAQDEYVADKARGGGAWAQAPKCPDDQYCSTTIVFRDPKRVEVAMVGAEGDLEGGSEGALGRLQFPLPQRGEYSFYPLSVGFGGSKSLGLTLDEFGRRTSINWSSNARGEEITGATQSVAEAAVAWQAARDAHDVKQDKAAVEALEAQQKRNKLEACRSIIEAGGYTCPSP